MKELKQTGKRPPAKSSSSYVYVIRVDGVVRYIGKGRNGRLHSHLIEAKRTADRRSAKIRNLYPHFRKMLVAAIRRGSTIKEKVIAANLTDAQAYTMERDMIGKYHKRWPALEYD